MNKSATGIYHSKQFYFPGIIHGFSTKKFGDMRIAKNRNAFLSVLGIDASSLVWQEQIHKDVIHIVSHLDKGKTISGVDGLVYCCHSGFELESSDDNKTIDSEAIVFSVHTADCVPILAVDPLAKVIGAAHAGWKGTLLHIGKTLVKDMEKLGATPLDIRIAIGPRIGACCYAVDDERELMFQKEFGQYTDIVVKRNEKSFVDLGKANYYDFLSVGISSVHIDYDPSLCTFCMKDDFYSFRRSGKPLEGEMIGVIGLPFKGLTLKG